ncbi:MAG: hypothetical protein C4533_02045 [Candidatus Omnitrophota bacterium]|jgi:hypothetical protein|nr:MAG: hypothetical protein C4533_02045 [Candidatus Omnitrophota bacterium]
MKKTAYLFIVVYFALYSLGCEAFIRKFSRKPKKEKSAQEKMVLEPQVYSPEQVSKEDGYRQNFIFWKSWQEELIDSLNDRSPNRKRQIMAANEAIKNLEYARTMLIEQAQIKLDKYIGQSKDLLAEIEADTYGDRAARSRFQAEQIRMNVLKEFTFSKIKIYLK